MAWGVDAATGRPLHGDGRIAQAILRLARTAGDLVMRRHLRTELHDRVGAPNDPVLDLAALSTVARAIEDGEPRCELRSLRFVTERDDAVRGPSPAQAADGLKLLFIDAVSRETGRPLELTELIG